MKALHKLRQWWRGNQNPFPNSTQVIELAFEIGGIAYYRHVDEANMPYKRALKALSVYNELNMRCDRYYLTRHTEAIEQILSAQKFSVNQLLELKKLNNQLSERLNWVYDEDLVYKLAAVRYFDANENPEDFDWKYALKKIERWKKEEEVGRFFLRAPIASLIPFLKDAAMNFAEYSAVQQQVKKVYLENICMNLSANLNETCSTATAPLFWEEMRPTNTW